jgi:hypothetical protein
VFQSSLDRQGGNPRPHWKATAFVVNSDAAGKECVGMIGLKVEDWNPLILYEASLDKTYMMDVKLVLPGHRAVFEDCRARIEELKQHHKTRAREVLTILKDRRMNAYEVASEMTYPIIHFLSCPAALTPEL